MKKFRYFYKLLLFVFILISCDQLKKVSEKKPTFSLDFFKKPEPITTSFEDAAKEKVLPDDFGNNLTPTPLDIMPRVENGGFQLSPGFYEMTCKSYCLHPGYGRPGKGDGYLVAPLKGDKTEIITSIIDNAEKKDAFQQDVQALLWAVLASTDFNKISPSLKATAESLLSKKQLKELSKSSIGVIPKEILEKAQQNMPPVVRKAMELQNKMRGAFEDINTKYEDLEKLAVPATSLTNDRPEYKRGRWCLHPDGYYIRYFPEGYSATRMQVYIPSAGMPIKSGKQNVFSFFKFLNNTTHVNPSGNVAVPANSGQQRLATSSQPKNGGSSSNVSNKSNNKNTNQSNNNQDNSNKTSGNEATSSDSNKQNLENQNPPKNDAVGAKSPKKKCKELTDTQKEFKDSINKGIIAFYVGIHSDFSPRNDYFPNNKVESHHAVNSVWMKANYSDYKAANAPTIFMRKDPCHSATVVQFNQVIIPRLKKEQKASEVDFRKISKEEYIKIANEQLDKADVPQCVRNLYFLRWEEHLLTLTKIK